MIKKGLKYLIIAAVMALCLCPYTTAAVGNSGTDFWLVFPKPYVGTTDVKSLIITSDTPVTGNVDIPGISFTQVFSVVPGIATTVALPSNAYAVSTDGIDQRAIHVTSTGDIVVYGFCYILYASDAFLGLPVSALGTEYIVLGFGGGFGAMPPNATGPQFAIAAAFDNTTVTITPSMTVGARVAGVPYDIIISRGETYELNNPTGDLTGTFITSDKPITVMGGNRCGGVPLGTDSANYLVEQLPPVPSWGKKFLGRIMGSRVVGDVFRVIASVDATTVMMNGVPVALLNRGQYYQAVLTSAVYIEADKPVLAAQYAQSYNHDSSPQGDPTFMLIMPVEQYLKSYTVSTAGPAWPGVNYIHVATDNGSTALLILDGSFVPAASFNPVGSSGYSVAQLSVGTGTHTLQSVAGFGVNVYGYSYADAYGYLGGSGIDDILHTPTSTPTITDTSTVTPMITATVTDTVTETATNTFTATPTTTATATDTITVTVTNTFTSTVTVTPTCTATMTPVFCFDLKGAFPNPSLVDINIVYSLCRDSEVTAVIYTVSGEIVRRLSQQGRQGYNALNWDTNNTRGRKCASGVFIYSIEAVSGGDSEKALGKLAVIK